MARNSPRGTPARVLLLFALLTGAVAVVALRESLEREQAFRVHYPTAVGDMDYYKPGNGPYALSAQGAVFSLEEDETAPMLRRDDQMFRVPLAVSLPRLYSTEQTWAEGTVPPLYLKTGDGEFLRVELHPGETTPAP